jgi:hypothetical protein
VPLETRVDAINLQSINNSAPSGTSKEFQALFSTTGRALKTALEASPCTPLMRFRCD